MKEQCMCGDPVCPRCGDPSLAKLEAISDEFYEKICKMSESEAKSIMVVVDIFIEAMPKIVPLLSAGIMENIGDVVADAHKNLRDEAEKLGLNEED